VSRSELTTAEGDYSFPALPAGEYEVTVETDVFQRMVRTASVEVGATTSADFTLRLGAVQESVKVEGASPQISYESHTVGGVITGSEIQNLPLNGRNFLELAKLEPGVHQ
jgi:Carboxypeptidase regulatory-like domain